jgi:hypothetical protein
MHLGCCRVAMSCPSSASITVINIIGSVLTVGLATSSLCRYSLWVLPMLQMEGLDASILLFAQENPMLQCLPLLHFIQHFLFDGNKRISCKLFASSPWLEPLLLNLWISELLNPFFQTICNDLLAAKILDGWLELFL